MTIIRATQAHLEGINRLLYQVADVHHQGRPDLFRANAKKYCDAEICRILADPDTPVFAAVDAQNTVMGYAFCILQEKKDHPLLMDCKTLYLDDLCVEESLRGRHIGKALLEHVRSYAKEIGCYHLTLNVWNCNPAAMRFYEANGFKPLKVGMEAML